MEKLGRFDLRNEVVSVSCRTEPVEVTDVTAPVGSKLAVVESPSVVEPYAVDAPMLFEVVNGSDCVSDLVKVFVEVQLDKAVTVDVVVTVTVCGCVS